MTNLMALAVVVVTLALAPGIDRSLEGRRDSRRSAWELERVAWRLRMLRPVRVPTIAGCPSSLAG
jgi:hypothetical protein